MGREMACLCRSLGMRVCYYDPHRQPEMEDIAEYSDLDELFSECDLVVLHVAYTPRSTISSGKGNSH